MSEGEAGSGLSRQMMAQPTAADLTKVTATQSSEVQLQRALEQVANISTALVDIHHYYQDKVIMLHHHTTQKRTFDTFTMSLFHPSGDSELSGRRRRPR